MSASIDPLPPRAPHRSAGDALSDRKVNISLLVDDVSLPLRVSIAEEALFRKAQQRINTRLNRYRDLYPLTASMHTNTHLVMACIDATFREEQMLLEQEETEQSGQQLEVLCQELKAFTEKHRKLLHNEYPPQHL